MDKILEMIKVFMAPVQELLSNSKRTLDIAYNLASLLWQGIVAKYGSEANKWMNEFVSNAIDKAQPGVRSVSTRFDLKAEQAKKIGVSSPAYPVVLASEEEFIGPYLGELAGEVKSKPSEEQPQQVESLQQNALVDPFESENQESGADWTIWFVIGVIVVASFIYRKEINGWIQQLLDLVGLGDKWKAFIGQVDNFIGFLSGTGKASSEPYSELRECIAVGQKLSLSTDQLLLLAKYLRRIDVSAITEQREAVAIARDAETVTKQQALSILNAIY